jgi:hypothetical protein
VAFHFVMPSEMTSLYASVAATVDSDYLPGWLCDGRCGRPSRFTDGSPSATITPSPAGDVSLVAVCNHNLDAGKAVTFGGDITATVTNGAVPANGIGLNPFTTISPVSGVDNVTMAVSGNSQTVVIGEIVFGKSRTIRAPQFVSPFEIDGHDLDTDAEFSSLMPYDRGLEHRVITGWNYYSTADKDLILEWFRSQRGGSRPSLIVPDSTINDAWLCKLLKPKWQQAGPGKYRVDLTFVEYPRSRW